MIGIKNKFSVRPKLKEIIILDCEMTCWQDKDDVPEDEVSEIIEIGICTLNIVSLEISQKTSYLIKPINSTISNFCTELTGITREDVKSGMRFDHACNKFRKEFAPKHKVVSSWGGGDREKIRSSCNDFVCQYPFGNNFIDASILFSICEGSKANISLDNALKNLGLKFEGRRHRAAEDAYNTARVLKEIFKRYRKGIFNAG